MNNIEKVLNILNDDVLYEFANLDDRHTGIKNIVIHVYSQGDGKKVQHGPRIKISNVYGKFVKNDTFVLDVKNGNIVEGKSKLTKKEVDTIRLWIAINKKAIIDYWNSEGEMITFDFYNSIKRIDE